MKINEIVLREMTSAEFQKNLQTLLADREKAVTSNPAAVSGYDAAIQKLSMDYNASQQTSSSSPAGGATQNKWPTTPAEIKAFQSANGLKVDGLIGDKTLTALHKAGVKAPPGFKPVPTRTKQAKKPATPAKTPDAMAGADAGDQTSSGYSAQSQAQKSAPDAMAGADAGDQTSSGYSTQSQAQKSAPAAPAATSSYTANSPQAQGGYAQSAVANTATQGQATQPDATQTSPDTGLSTAPKPMMSRSGPTNVTTGSDDEMAWRQKNPNWSMTGAQYPGPGQWDPKTGRSKKDMEAGQKNWDALKGFFGGKKQPAPNQGTQPAPAPAAAPSTLGELTDIRKLAGLR